MVNTISTFLSDNFELTRGRVNYEGKGKTTREEFRFTSVPLYLWDNVQCKFEQQPIGSALLALHSTVRQLSKRPAVYGYFYSTHR